MSCKKLIHCIGLAIAEKGLKGLAGAVPFGAVVYDIAFNARERYLKVCVPGNELQEISFAANATPDQIKGQVAEVIEEIKKNATPAIAGELKNPEIEQKLKSYLQQVPSAIRASMRRPSDPSGKSLSSGFSLGKGDAFVKLLPENLPKFKPGESPVGNWKLVELLGVGGFGEVWKAEHPTLKGIPPVALKFCLSPESAKFIRHEGQLLSRIMECSANNPGIVKLKQAYIDSEINCLEYEFVNGGDLCGLLADWLQLSKEKRIQVALQMLLNLARTIAPLHRMNPPIVHRDLKPANILIVKIDNKILLKVTDFGIGGFASKQHLDQNTKGFDQSNILTQTLRGSHTPLYASPEQQKGETPHPTDDVHSLGVIGLQLLLCDLTIGPTGDWDVELKELGVNEKLIEILKTCLARQSRRFQDASILASELQKLINEKPEGSVSKIIPKQETLKTEEKPQNSETNNNVWQNISKQKKRPTKPSNLKIKKISFVIASAIVVVLISLFAVLNPSKKNLAEINLIQADATNPKNPQVNVNLQKTQNLAFSFDGDWQITHTKSGSKISRTVKGKDVLDKNSGSVFSWNKIGDEITVIATPKMWDKLKIDVSNPNILKGKTNKGTNVIWERINETQKNNQATNNNTSIESKGVLLNDNKSEIHNNVKNDVKDYPKMSKNNTSSGEKYPKSISPNQEFDITQSFTELRKAFVVNSVWYDEKSNHQITVLSLENGSLTARFEIQPEVIRIIKCKFYDNIFSWKHTDATILKGPPGADFQGEIKKDDKGFFIRLKIPGSVRPAILLRRIENSTNSSEKNMDLVQPKTNEKVITTKSETSSAIKLEILEPFSVRNTGKKYYLTIPENFSKVEVGFYQDSPNNITLNGAWNSLLTINENKIVAFKKDPVLNQMKTFVFENYTNNTTYKILNNYQIEKDVKLIDVTKQVKIGSNEVFFYHEQKKEMLMGLIFKIYTK